MGPLSASVVIPTYRRADGIVAAVRAVLEDPVAGEVVVVVDGSRDGTLERLEALAVGEPRVRPHWIEPGGAMAARQAGLERAQGDVVVLLDDDVLAGPGLVGAHLALHAARRRLVAVGYMPVADALARADVGPRLYARWYEEQCARYEAQPERVLIDLWLGNISLRREDALRVGLLNPAFRAGYNEDKELGVRLHEAGLRGLFHRSARATHLYRRPLSRFVADGREVGRGMWQCHALHPATLGPVPSDIWLAGLRAPERALVAVGARPRGALARVPLLAAARLAGAIRARRMEAALVTLVRHAVQRRAAIEASRSYDIRPPSERRRCFGGEAADTGW